jgi:hypothetical protein
VVWADEVGVGLGFGAVVGVALGEDTEVTSGPDENIEDSGERIIATPMAMRTGLGKRLKLPL